MKSYWPAVLFLAGIYIAAFGLSAMRYSRWDHAKNADIPPVFHPWAIVVGLFLTGLAYWVKKSKN